MDRYLVISSDGHAGLPPEQYRDYVDPQYREEFDRQLAAAIAERAAAENAFLISEFNTKWRAENAGGLDGAWDSAIRNKVMDDDGVTAVRRQSGTAMGRCARLQPLAFRILPGRAGAPHRHGAVPGAVGR